MIERRGGALVLDLLDALASPPALTCGAMRARVAERASELLRCGGDEGVELPEWAVAAAPPKDHPWSRVLSARAVVRAHQLLMGGRSRVPLRRLLRTEGHREEDALEDARRIAEAWCSLRHRWPLLPAAECEANYRAILSAMEILEVRPTGTPDPRGRGLYATRDLDLSWVGRVVAPYPGVSTAGRPAEGSPRHGLDARYAIESRQRAPGYVSHYHLDRSGTLGLEGVRLPLAQFANEPLDGTEEVHNARHTSKGLVLLKPVLRGDQILVCYGPPDQYPREGWDYPACCGSCDSRYLASEAVGAERRTGASSSRPGKFLYRRLTREQVGREYEERRSRRAEVAAPQSTLLRGPELSTGTRSAHPSRSRHRGV